MHAIWSQHACYIHVHACTNLSVLLGGSRPISLATPTSSSSWRPRSAVSLTLTNTTPRLCVCMGVCGCAWGSVGGCLFYMYHNEHYLSECDSWALLSSVVVAWWTCEGVRARSDINTPPTDGLSSGSQDMQLQCAYMREGELTNNSYLPTTCQLLT